MKRIFYTLALIAVAATACQKESFEPEGLDKKIMDTVTIGCRYIYRAPVNSNYVYETEKKSSDAFISVTDDDMLKLCNFSRIYSDCTFVHQDTRYTIGRLNSAGEVYDAYEVNEDNGWFIKRTFVKKALADYYDMLRRPDEEKTYFASTIRIGEFLLGLLDGEYSISVEGWYPEDSKNLVVIDAGTGWDYTETNFVVERVYIEKNKY